MRLAVTGGTGFVGRFIVEAALAAGHAVTLLGRRPPEAGLFGSAVLRRPFDLGGEADLVGMDALVHAAFDHLPGRYRGGEGDDPEGFLARNREGSIRLFEAGRSAGLKRCVFLSSRAVYGAYPPGTRLSEELDPRPDTLYGRAKHEVEVALAALARRDFQTVSLRVTGVYGPAPPGRGHKWTGLFRRFLGREPIEPRLGTEVHGEDVASAVLLCLKPGQPPRLSATLNVSDLVLDRRDLLAEVAALTGCAAALPPRALVPVSEMDTGRLRALGWRPGGSAKLRATLPGLLGLAPGPGGTPEAR